MRRLLTFSMLLAVAVAQNGYEYNKPGQPFTPGTTPSQPGFSGTLSAPTGPSAPNQGYPAGAQPSQQGYPGPGGPTAQTGYPGSGGQPAQQGYQGKNPTGPSFPGQGSSAPSFSGQGPPPASYPGQAPSGPSYSGQAPNSGAGGQTGSNYYNTGSNSGQNYQGQPGGPSGPGQTQNYPSGPGQPGGSGPFSDDTGAYPGGDYSAIPGEPDKDYPILSEIPTTSFKCDAQAYPGYYADVETRCQVFHVCANKIQYDFLCPNGTIFSQDVFVCVWWNQFDCNSAPSLYDKNANLYANTSGGFGPSASLNDYPNSDQSLAYPGAPQGFPAGYPGSPGSQGSGYSEAPGPQGPSSRFPGAPGQQGPPSGYPGASGPTNYPGQSSQEPQASYPGSAPQGPTNGYPTASGSQSYPGSQGSSGFPGTDNSQGYPSGKPSGPSFPNSRPLSSGVASKTPNREYLPPV